jgi:hypothetical protein
LFNLCSGKTVGCGRWRRASVKLLCIITGTGRSMLRSRPLTLATHILVRASSRVRPWTRVHSFLLHAQCLYYAFSLKSAFRHPPQPPFLHTSPNSWQSNFPLLHLSGLVRLSAASLKGCTTTLLSIKIHGRGFAPSHEYSASATPSVRQ